MNATRRTRFQQLSSEGLENVIIDMCRIHPSASRVTMQDRYAKIAERRERLNELLLDLCKDMKVQWEPYRFDDRVLHTVTKDMPNRIDSENVKFGRYLKKKMSTYMVGRIKLTTNQKIARYTFYEVRAKKGFWQNNFRQEMTTHHINRVRFTRMPAKGIEMPEKARWMVDRIMQEEVGITKYFSVVTGQLAYKETVKKTAWKEDTKLKKGVDAVIERTRKGVEGLRSGINSMEDSLGKVLAAADPAIVIGDICFYGWEL